MFPRQIFHRPQEPKPSEECHRPRHCTSPDGHRCPLSTLTHARARHFLCLSIDASPATAPPVRCVRRARQAFRRCPQGATVACDDLARRDVAGADGQCVSGRAAEHTRIRAAGEPINRLICSVEIE